MALLTASATAPEATHNDRKRLIPFSMRAHLMAMSILLTMGPVVIFGMVQARMLRGREIAEVTARHHGIATGLAREIDFFVSDALDYLTLLAGMIHDMKSLRAEALESHARRILDMPEIDHVTVLTPSGRSIVNLARSGRLPTGVDYSDRPFIRSLMSRRMPQLSAPLVGKVSGKPELFLGFPVLDSHGDLKAILDVGLNMAELQRRHLSEHGTGPPSRALLLDPSGRPVASSDRSFEDLFAAGQDVRIAPEKWEGDPRLMTWTDERGHRTVGASALLPGAKWRIVCGIPERHLREALAAPIRQVAHVAFWLLLACVIVSQVLARILAAPIRSLEHQAKRIAGGALGERIALPRHLSRELLELSSSFNTMSAQLASNSREVQDRLGEIETLLAVSQTLGSTLDLQEVLRRGARVLARTLDADTTGAYLISPDGTQLEPYAGYRLPKANLASLRTIAIPLHWNAFVDEAFKGRRTIFCADRQNDPRFDERTALFSFRAVVMVPLFARDEILGGLFGIWWERPHTPTPRELELADGIGRQLALAIANARLYQESLRRATALAESEDRYRRLAEGATDIIFTVDVKGRFTYLNPRIAQVLGYRPEELLGKPSIAYVAPRDHARLKEIFTRALRGESAFDIFELEAIRKDESAVSLELGASTIYDAQGRVIGRQGIARDLSERRRLEEEVRERKRLEAINRFKSQFLANMSHELRTPLHSVIGFSEVLQDSRHGPLSEKQTHFVKNILVSGRHLLALIDDILDLAKIEAGKMTLHIARVDPRAAIQEICGVIQHQATVKRQNLLIVVDQDLGVCLADRQRLNQILLNLLSNAIKFTPDGGRITVTAKRGSRGEGPGSRDASPLNPKPSTLYAGDFIEIAVTDTGIGISADNLSRLFQEFEQLEPLYTKAHQGSGLGLALCKHLVELHGGGIWASSEGEGRGSTFTFTIPAAPRQERASHA